MGNVSSHQKNRKQSQQQDTTIKSSLSAVPNISSDSVTAPSNIDTPPLSSRSSSRPISIIGDVKRLLAGRSASTIDVSAIGNSSILNIISDPIDNISEEESHCDDATHDGRTYQANNNKYCLPIDEEEQDRLTNTHYVLKHCFGENFSAPVHDLLSKYDTIVRDPKHSTLSQPSCTNKGTPARILDVACGSGVWVLEMATEFPDCFFHGIDQACIYPTTIKPPNTTFRQWDILDSDGFPYPDGYFDFVHMRLVYNCFSLSDLKFVMSEINRVLKPGGYLECRDIDPMIKNPGPTTEEMFSSFTSRMSQLHSVDVTWTQRMCEVLSTQAELTDIHQQQVSISFGQTGPLAASIDCSISDALKSCKQFFVRANNISSEVCDIKIEKILLECPEYRSFFNYYMAWGRKPLVTEQLSSHQESPPVPLTPTTNDYFPQFYSTDCNNSALESAMSENAFDIVHFADGFIE